MSRRAILQEIVEIRQRMLDRRLYLKESMPGAVSEEEIEEKTLDLLEAQLRLVDVNPD